MVNIKLDKTGGLTEALATARAVEVEGLPYMVGCMLESSLGLAPATLLADRAVWRDLDGPLLIARDRRPSLTYADGLLQAPLAELWG
jgi:L-alanine-DL-glutamate epimerase-like enolase superfamily enzyme